MPKHEINNKVERPDSRKQEILDTAAVLFSEKGYHALSMRGIAKETGMLPGSLYCHFSSKEDLLYSIYAEGVKRISFKVDAAVAEREGSWDRLEAACSTHLEVLLDQSAYAQVVVRILPHETGGIRERLIALRNEYESRFRVLIDALEMAPDVNRKHLRLFLLGALNSAQEWYQPGADTPEMIAKELVKIIGQKIKLSEDKNNG
ncbi:MAG: TetR/AcrR family transcriptional regulator [Gammaproteobacteria bacterium]|nr:MAG: TetR/AcrR family transcriptional regulator [Gammaproteobacteria bacterium]RLA22975.1 MAG: TetR/AcrR family transcriptional regulator [Gammaproteobacteria bacterium]